MRKKNEQEMGRKGAVAPLKTLRLALPTVRSELDQNIWLGPKKYLGKLLWLHAHPLEYPDQAGKKSGRPLSVWV